MSEQNFNNNEEATFQVDPKSYSSVRKLPHQGQVVEVLPDEKPPAGWVPMNPTNTLPNTYTPPITASILYVGGGLGDYICWLPAVTKLLEHQTHITKLKIFTSTWFKPLAENYFSNEPRVKLYTHEEFKKKHKDTDPVVPMLELRNNATGHHLMEVGFMHIFQGSAPREWYKYPQFDTTNINLEHFSLPPNYIIITTGATTTNRQITPEAVNKVSDWCNTNGYTPVYLGKSSISKSHYTHFPEQIDYSKGIDLRNKTSLLQALKIIEQSAAIVGVDNGLLHLAGCTPTPIIMGMTNVKPEHRQILRDEGETIYLTPPKELSCRFCQSNVRALLMHSFSNCLYKHYYCIYTLKGENFISALQSVTTPIVK